MKDSVTGFLARRDSFAVLLHVKPDGDSIGSSIALGLALEKLGKRVAFVKADDIPDNMRFLTGIERFRHWSEVDGGFDGAILIDCSDPERVGEARQLLRRCEKVINIDHHRSNRCYGDLNLIDPAAASAGEVVYRVIQELGVELDLPMAMAIYVSILTDTGSFAYESTSPGTHIIAAELIRKGVRPAEVSRAVWENRPLSAIKLLARALDSLTLDEGGLAWLEVTQKDFQEAGARPAETEGIVNYPRTIAGVELAALFIEEGNGEVKVSLRSNSRVDVSRIAQLFGGGGHARAAGFTIQGALAEVKEWVLPTLRQAVRGDDGGQQAQGQSGG